MVTVTYREMAIQVTVFGGAVAALWIWALNGFDMLLLVPVQCFFVCRKIWHRMNRYIGDWDLSSKSFGTVSMEKESLILLGLLNEQKRGLRTSDQKMEALDWYLKSLMTWTLKSPCLGIKFCLQSSKCYRKCYRSLRTKDARRLRLESYSRSNQDQ